MEPLHVPNHVALKNILLATDLSPGATNALFYARCIAQQYGSTLFVVHVMHPDVYPFQLPETWPLMRESERERRQVARRDIEKTLRGVQHEIICRDGPVWEALSSVIESKEIDLVVLGTHGRTGMTKALMGSVAEQIFRQAACPVLTVGPSVCITPETQVCMKKILFATDFSPESLAAAAFAISFARENGAELILLHRSNHSEDADAMWAALRDIVPLGTRLQQPPLCLLTGGPVAESILDVAGRELVDLIVLGVQAANWRLIPETHFTNSMAYQVVTQASCPVLTIRDITKPRRNSRRDRALVDTRSPFGVGH
jgi:nucleotide-binding universal stress UspA family protein